MELPAWTTKPTTSEMSHRDAFTIRSPADFYVAEMDRHDTVLRKALAANFAINADPGCIEAHLFMGLHLRDRDYGMLHLQRAVETGDQLWGPVAEREGKGMVW